MEYKCGYFNKDGSCNYTDPCSEDKVCTATNSNKMNVTEKALRQMEHAIYLLKKVNNIEETT